MSSIGANSPASVRAASSAVASSHARPASAASVAVARRGVAATPPQPIRADAMRPSATTSATHANTAEMSWSYRLPTLYARSSVPGARRGTRTSTTNSDGCSAVFR